MCHDCGCSITDSVGDSHGHQGAHQHIQITLS